jgi:hypothetical protein
MLEQTSVDRRAVVRALCGPEGQARAGEFYEGRPRWGWVADASLAGLGLLLPAPFRGGALLLVTLRGQHEPYSALARVAHATACPDGNYRVGCALNAPLPAEVLDMLTAGHAAPPPGGTAALTPALPA